MHKLCTEPLCEVPTQNLAVSGDTASLDLRWDSDSSCVGSSAGQYCLIPVPKDCTAAELNLIYDPD